jgi:tetratricopeptide (TPR) repeat protein
MPLSRATTTVPEAFATLPDPSRATSLTQLVEQLRQLKVWAGDPSYETIKDRVNAAWTAAGRPAADLTIRSTVANCFQPARRRLNTDLVLAVVQALHPETGYVAQWRQALRVISGEIEAVSQVRVEDRLPPDLAGFTGRLAELDRLRTARSSGDAVVISAIEGMAGVGKTQLAVHAGHVLHREEPFERVLFVNLRGFHPDPAQPPADPAAVLDGFLRLLGMPGHQIPHDLTARTAAYRTLLTGVRALVVLDNAANADQVGPLLPRSPGCLTLVTSRRSLAPLKPGTHLTVDVFTPGEALTFLAHAVPGVPVGADRDAAARIAHRCGYLPLALSLIAGHIRNRTGWTLTDHADRLDERHRERRLDSGVELALALSYQHLPAGEQRLLRLAALHPGQDVDAYAAAALTGTDLATASAGLSHLCADHLLQPAAPGRYACHDLVRAFATGRAHDEDRPAARRDALTRLFDFYLSTSAAAMSTLYAAESHLRPQISPARTPAPDLTDPDAALAWLDVERPALIAVTGDAVAHGWPTHATRLAGTISRYLQGGHYADALTVHGHAYQAALRIGDPAEQAHALSDLGVANLRMGRREAAGEHFQRALDLFRQTDDPAGEARARYNLGALARMLGDYPNAVDYYRQALDLYRQAGDQCNEARALSGIGLAMKHSGRLAEAVRHLEQSLTLARQIGDAKEQAFALHGLGETAVHSGRYSEAADHLRQTRLLYRQVGNRAGEGGVLDSLGMLHVRLGRPDEATAYFDQALAIFRETGGRDGQCWVLNGLGEAATAAGRPAEALRHHAEADALAAEVGARDQQARAHAGRGRAHHARGEDIPARRHYEHALALYTDLGVPDAEEVRTHLAALDADDPDHP